MDTKLLITFVVLNIANVIIQTVKSLVTIKCGKGAAAIVNAVAFGLYTVVTVYMLCELPLAWKAGIVAFCNLVGVYVVKWAEEKSRKDKLWKVEATIPTTYAETVDYNLTLHYIPHSFVKLSDKHTVFYCYCETQEQSKTVKKILDNYWAKYFVSESKTL
jgi:hypothetical protein